MPDGPRPRHHVGHVDWSFGERPLPSTPAMHGLARQVVVGPAQGAVHTELAVGVFQPGGWLARHVHSFEEALYVLEGELALEIGGRAHRLVKGDYGLMTVGTWHALANAGDAPVRFLSVNTPQRVAPDSGRRDTFFERGTFDAAALVAAAERPPFGDPTLRFVGHYEGTPPQAEALALPEQVRGRRPAGMDTALLAYSGISVKMLVDRGFGADLLTVFTVDYEPRGAAQAHDHPFEETYVFLDGEIEAELDGEHHVLRPGDVVFAGVGSLHGFFNTGSGRVRWIETQAPQPPARHAYRWPQSWARFEEERT
ncbi:MAG TPA: cupin domain-containing protein [Candidatus Limnocylindrales bacterium]|nr:cupin domain-containing protein [Candidatus Limnocylindrales bacterium]